MSSPQPPSSTTSSDEIDWKKKRNPAVLITNLAPQPFPHEDEILSPGRNIAFQPVSRAPTPHQLDLDDYFAGPRDIQKHSKWPFFMRLHGSVMPKMILPLTAVAVWSSVVTCVNMLIPHNGKTQVLLSIDTVLLTVLGFVVGLALSFRCTTAYERYSDGRKAWSQLSLLSRNLSRLIWVQVNERHAQSEDLGKSDLLGKVNAMNLICAFSLAVMHRLRFEPAADYADLTPYISHLTNVMAVNADQSALQAKKLRSAKVMGEYLGVSFAQSNPRKLIKRSKDNLGNLPLEILTYLQSYIAQTISNGTLAHAGSQVLALNDIRALAEVLGNCERVLNTPLPIAYCISISQITWVYIVALPFQLVGKLQWVTIPASIIAAYIILGLSIIGREIENPFGNDVNDLPLNHYCHEIAADIDVLTSAPAPQMEDYLGENPVMFPLSVTPFADWQKRSVYQIRQALRDKAMSKVAKKSEAAKEKLAAMSVDV